MSRTQTEFPSPSVIYPPSTTLNFDQEKENEAIVEDAPSNTAPLPPASDFPEGGLRAWSVVCGGFFAFIATFGVTNSYGVFQDYYSANLLQHSSSSTIALIGAIQLFFLYGGGPIVGRIYDAYGTRVLIPLGSVIIVFSLMMVSLVQPDKPYQLFLAQGILFGLGLACIFNPALAVAGHWFKRKRAYAIGVIASGSSIGGVFFPIMLQRLIPSVGFPWAVRAMAFVCLGCLTIATLTIRTRLPPSRNITLRGLVDLEGFRDWKYVCASIGAFLVFYAVFTPYFYIQIYANMQGVPNSLAIYLLPIINAFGTPSRIIPGIMADKWGCLNVLVPSTLIASIFTLALWLPARSAASITAYAAMYGLFTGAFVTLLPAYIYTISPIEVYGARLGSMYLLVGIANLVGTPTAGAFLSTVDQSGFNGLIIFTGVLMAAGSLILGMVGVVTEMQKRREAAALETAEQKA
ncbi:monocarboxylate permease [Laetiporus sulphureus 93-53]|uniref:Monocarboxylate permease n=1 Tax=Laetiporus sulphureus 93-53 TaxID=1314785 RepID=A0A165BNB3_9APHY|nr:monocarboxylate permease [Laetiporus sulphureus 93-53]KZT01355.1 monocarboxylate permease [Laetiporus sulphureus 93-53]